MGGWGGGGGAGGMGGAGGAGGAGPEPPRGNTNINLGGAQDMGYFRRLLDDGIIPTSEDFEAAGFFAEHHTPLPEPDCGERVCVQAMLGVMGNLINGNNCTMLQIGLNSPIVADPGSRPPLNLSVVVDVSGSMRDAGKIDFVRQGLEQLIDALHDDDQVALITYSSDATVLFEMAALRDGRNQLRSLVRRIDAGGATNLFEGLESGFRQSLGAYDSGRQNRLILLSDGNPTAGITNTDAIMAMSRAFNSEGVGITSVGLGTDFNYELMRGLAEQGDGNYYFVEDAAAVDEVFSQEISYFTVPVAFDLELELSAGSDYRFVRAHGSSFWEDTADGGRLSVPSVFLAHRVSHDDVEPGGGRRGGGSALLIELMPDVTPDGREPGEARVAEITARFREPGSDRIVEAHVPVLYPGLPWEVRRQGFFDNRIVEKSFVMLNIYVGLVNAVDMWHLERDRAGAMGLILRLIAAVEDYEDSANEGEGDVDMQLDVELLDQLLALMRAQDDTEPDVSDMPEDPWPAD
ncbi:MAG: VWA domain-containing protein [Myxococcales bacterium]|nr:VWA domain-containing protein [Myxococcales bacterium]